MSIGIGLQLLYISTYESDTPKETYQVFSGIFSSLAVAFIIFTLASSIYSGGLKTVLVILLIVGLVGEIYLTNSLDKPSAIGGEYTLLIVNALLRLWLLIDLNGQTRPVFPELIQAIAQPASKEFEKIDLNNIYGKTINVITNACKLGKTDQEWNDIKDKLRTSIGLPPKDRPAKEPVVGGKRR